MYIIFYDWGNSALDWCVANRIFVDWFLLEQFFGKAE